MTVYANDRSFGAGKGYKTQPPIEISRLRKSQAYVSELKQLFLWRYPPEMLKFPYSEKWISEDIYNFESSIGGLISLGEVCDKLSSAGNVNTKRHTRKRSAGSLSTLNNEDQKSKRSKRYL